MYNFNLRCFFFNLSSASKFDETVQISVTGPHGTIEIIYFSLKDFSQLQGDSKERSGSGHL